MAGIDEKLKKLKGENSTENSSLFYEICADVSKIFEAGKLEEFKRISGKPLASETALSGKLFWIRTLSLEGGNLFTALYPEPAFCTLQNKEHCSAGMLGLWHGGGALELASVEVKAGKTGVHLLYAAAEGLRNLAFAWHGLKEQEIIWKKNYSSDWEGPWQKISPFKELNKKQARLLIIGNPAWIKENAQSYLNLLPETIKIGSLHAEVSVYSTGGGGSRKTSPVMLLPLRKIHPLKKHILDVMADIYSNSF